MHRAKGQRTEAWDYPLCSFGECGRAAVYGDGLCTAHNAQRLRAGVGGLRPLRRTRTPQIGVCVHDGCSQPKKTLGLCGSHYSQKLAHGRTWDLHERFSCSVGWCSGTYTRNARSNLCKNHVLLARTYGLSHEHLVALYADYTCRICRSSGPRLHIDHDHACCPGGNGNKCGKCVRGLLCQHCNHLIGNAKEDTEILKRAIAYIEEHAARDLLA